MTQVRVGQRYRDNDPRMNGRVVEVIEVAGTQQAVCLNIGNKRKVCIALYRMHQDGKPRKTGFSLVSAEKTA